MTPRALALIALAGGLLATASPAQPPNDPLLPPGVIARLGSPLFRAAGVLNVNPVSPDGRLVYGRCERYVYAWDATTGRQVFRVEVGRDVGGRLFATLYPSANGIGLLVQRENRAEGYDFVTLDPNTGRELNRTRLPGDQSISTVSPDGTRFVRQVAVPMPGQPPPPLPGMPAPGTQWKLQLHETATGREIAELAQGNFFPVQFSPDGRAVVVHQYDAAMKAFDAVTGKPIAEYPFGGDNGKSITFIRAYSYDYRLYHVGPGGTVVLFWMESADKKGVLRAWEPGTGKAWDIGPGDQGAAEDGVAISPDGKRVATFRRNIGWLVRELATGKEIARLPFDGPREVGVFSPDGNTLYTHADLGSVITARDIATGKVRSPEPDPPGVITQLEFTGPNTLVGLSDGNVITWDAATGRRVAKAGPFPIEKANLPRWVLSADGRRVARFESHGTMAVYDVATGRVLWSDGGTARNTNVGFSPDGKRVYIATENNLRAVNTDTGTDPWTAGVSAGSWGRVVTDPSGRWLALAGAQTVVERRRNSGIEVLEAATGHRRHHWDLGRDEVQVAAFAPDGRYLCVAASDMTARSTGVRILDPETGSTPHSFGPLTGQSRSITASPDGRTVAVGMSDGRVHLVDPVAGGVRHTFAGHAGRVEAVRFRSDGKVLAAASPEAPVYLWDVYGTHVASPKPTAAELAKAGDDLASADAAAGFRAVKALVAGGNESLPVLKAGMAAVRFPDPAAIQKLIIALDSDDFATREKAAKELAAIARLAEPQLRAAVKDPPSLEVRKRAEQILAAATKPVGDELRAIRAVEAAEVIGTADAGKLLAEWAATGGVLAREAQAATARLRK